MSILKTRDIILISVFATLMAVGSYVRIPAPLVDITLQIFFAILCPLIVGRKRSMAAMAIYVLMGLIGIPVFSGGGGFGYVLSPSFGYLLGFVLCANVTGFLIENCKCINFKNCFLASLCGVFSCYTIGVIYLFVIMRFVLNLEIGNIFVTGFLIFLPWDLLKITIAAISAPKIYKALYRL